MVNDRFKFRFWNTIRNKYEDTYCCSSRGMTLDYVVPEQCTGLRDKNGNLIYEGDIVRRYVGLGRHGSQKTEDIDVVKWHVNGYVLENYCDYFADTDDFEVIGNIHENPDLIESEDE